MFRKLIILCLSLLLVTGCLRFVPARDLDGKVGSVIDDDKTAYILDEATFYAHEKVQKQRLEKLLMKRKSLADEYRIPSYKVGAEDLLQFQVFDIEELNVTARVRPDGYISLPLIGEVQVADLQEEQIQKIVAQKLTEYVHNPQVSVFVTEYAAHKVSVIGEVNVPGRYALKSDRANIIDMISEAGGKKNLSSGIVLLIPADSEALFGRSLQAKEGSPKSIFASGGHYGIEIYYEDLIGRGGSQSLAIPLVPGDVVVVQEPGTVHVDGEVKTPGAVQPSSRMTLLGAIAAAGGLTYSADVSKVEVVRQVGGDKLAYLAVNLEEIALESGKDIRLRDGDVIRVPSHGGRFVTRQFVDMFNRFVNFTVGGSVDVMSP